MTAKDSKKIIKFTPESHEITQENTTIKKMNKASQVKKGELFHELFASRESKEKMKTPELEKENYKIDKELSVDEKLKKGREKIEAAAYINGPKNVTLLKKQIDGPEKNAFVREIMDDGVMPKYLAGEQLFNRYAVLNLGLEKRLPNAKQMNNIRGGRKNHTQFLKENFAKDGKLMFPGGRDSDRIGPVGDKVYCRLSNDDKSKSYNLEIGKRTIYAFSVSPSFANIVRLLKE